MELLKGNLREGEDEVRRALHSFACKQRYMTCATPENGVLLQL